MSRSGYCRRSGREGPSGGGRRSKGPALLNPSACSGRAPARLGRGRRRGTRTPGWDSGGTRSPAATSSSGRAPPVSTGVPPTGPGAGGRSTSRTFPATTSLRWERPTRTSRRDSSPRSTRPTPGSATTRSSSSSYSEGPASAGTREERLAAFDSLPKVGDIAPDFEIVDVEGRRRRVSQYRGRKQLVVVFSRAHW